MKQFIQVEDVPDKDVESLVQEAIKLKKQPFQFDDLGKHKTLGLIFFNQSLRTRLSTQRAAQNLGMDVISMNMNSESWQLEFQDGTVMDGNTQEHVREAAAVISQYCDIIGIRTFASLTDRGKDYREDVLSKFMQFAKVPIVNLESAIRHPLQSLADLITIEEHKKIKRPKVVLSWAPHPRALPQAVANSFVEWVKNSDAELVVTHPEGYELADEFVQDVSVVTCQQEAFEGADFIYAKNWSAYQDYGKILLKDNNWTITEEKMNLTNQARFMHCLPVRRNMIVSDAVIDHENSLVLEQARNRIFAAQVVLKKILEWKN
ncbi:N-acetylornithine carbamoyltransferase [Fulvivirgaceae bacterium BMA10]|uniref:N-succinylornithine carbamoyltransferase n=1 Tax=Splendidivirga corallicola TaxID=3051826 RepID=A0ABT8KLK2_9BACT|nr:N-acetylornithine carbamoyltransferase [Fulvivirgaceae bacterium BMA10]